MKRQSQYEEDEIYIHRDYLFHFALCRVEKEVVAQDLVQETFLAAIRSRSSFKGQSCIRVWLVGILRHKIGDYLRRTCREKVLFPVGVFVEAETEYFGAPVSWHTEAQNHANSPSRQLEFVEFWECLNCALDKLPFRTARVFQLYEIEGETGASVCARLQISPENLWVMLHRARKKLGEELASWRYSST